jgi:hypothetical protein
LKGTRRAIRHEAAKRARRLVLASGEQNHMRKAVLFAAAAVLCGAPLWAGSGPALTGDYVEARTAEVFTGGCIMNSEAETMGRQAVLAWRVSRGSFHGVPLDGLSVVAAVAGDRNLGMREMGGEAPTRVRAAVVVDERADRRQRDALVAFVREATSGLVAEIADVTAGPIRFEHDGDLLRVAAGDASLAVQTRIVHDVSCGAMQWFHPLSQVEQASIGITKTSAYWGTALGTRWRQVERKSAFWGTFAH